MGMLYFLLNLLSFFKNKRVFDINFYSLSELLSIQLEFYGLKTILKKSVGINLN